VEWVVVLLLTIQASLVLIVEKEIKEKLEDLARRV
jgi:hypothetical protein